MATPPRALDELTVKTLMAPVVATITPETPVGAVHRVLEQHGIRHVPVLDGDLLAGIVSDRDLLRSDSDATPARAVMQRTVFVLAPDTPLSRAARIFRIRRLPVLPVVDGRTLVGMLPAVAVLETAWDHAKS